MLYDGKIVYEGTPEDMLTQSNEYTKQFVTASLEGPMHIISENWGKHYEYRKII